MVDQASARSRFAPVDVAHTVSHSHRPRSAFAQGRLARPFAEADRTASPPPFVADLKQ